MSIIQAHSALIARLAELRPRAIPTFPEPEDFMERVLHMREIALEIDAYVLALGRECQENIRDSFDISLFVAPLTNALDGNAIYVIECVAEELAGEQAREGDRHASEIEAA